MQAKKKSSIFQQVGVFLGTVLVMGIAVGAVALGSVVLTKRADNVATPDPAALASVAVARVQFEDHYTIARSFLGQVEATSDASLSFELSGRLADLTVQEGQSVTKGELLARLDTALLEAERTRLTASREASNAQLTFAQTGLDRAEQLRGEGFSSQETLDQARATRNELYSQIAALTASLSTVEINLEKSALYAPFDGVIGALETEISETVNPGQTILTVVESAAPQVRVGIPLNVTRDILQQVTIEVAGQQYPAVLQQLRPDIDPITRTRTALFALQTEETLAFGQTASLLVQTDVPARGAWVSLDALQQGSGSIWTVLVVHDGVVRTAAVEVLYQQSDRAYVQGSFDENAKLISTGTHRVVPGQRVQVLDGEV